MKNIKKLASDIHKGKNLRVNLELYRDMAVGSYHDYSSIELVFSAYILMEELNEIRPAYAKKEEKILSKIHQGLSMIATDDSDLDAIIQNMSSVRAEITQKMDLFTAYTDRLICFEYVLNRMEGKYLSEKELKEKLDKYKENDFMQRMNLHIFGTQDQAVITENIRTVCGQLPVRLTKAKFFEKLSQALTLYKGSDKSSLESFVYMIRTSGMLYELNEYKSEYPSFAEFIEKLESVDYAELAEDEYDELAVQLEAVAKDIHEITDFYYSMQKVVNSIFAVALCRKYEVSFSAVVEDAKKAVAAIEIGNASEEMLIPFEGKIEAYVEQSSYLEAVLFEIRSSYKEDLEALNYVELFDDLVNIANLLSGSLFVDMEQSANEEKADEAYISEITEKLVKELDERFSEVKKPVKRAMMGMILEKLPMIFNTSNDALEYIRSNLFGCTDKVEKLAVLEILASVLEEDAL